MNGLANFISGIADAVGDLMGNMVIAIPVVAIIVVYFVWIKKK